MLGELSGDPSKITLVRSTFLMDVVDAMQSWPTDPILAEVGTVIFSSMASTHFEVRSCGYTACNDRAGRRCTFVYVRVRSCTFVYVRVRSCAFVHVGVRVSLVSVGVRGRSLVDVGGRLLG